MLRLVGYFALVFVALYVLRHVPVVGELFRIPLLGFIVAAALVSAGISWYGVRALDARSARAMVSRLGAVDTPHNQGKLGAFVLSQGRARKAIPHLERAVAGEAGSAEWNYRLGCAYLASRRPAEAARVLEDCTRIDPDHAFGAAQVRLSEAHLRAGAADRALAAIQRFEDERGANPESAYHRGQALARLGRKPEARAAFTEVGHLAAHSARFQRAQQRSYTLRAGLRRLLP